MPPRAREAKRITPSLVRPPSLKEKSLCMARLELAFWIASLCYCTYHLSLEYIYVEIKVEDCLRDLKIPHANLVECINWVVIDWILAIFLISSIHKEKYILIVIWLLSKTIQTIFVTSIVTYCIPHNTVNIFSPITKICELAIYLLYRVFITYNVCKYALKLKYEMTSQPPESIEVTPRLMRERRRSPIFMDI